MKKIFSILALLLLLVAFYPTKVKAQKNCDEYKIWDEESNYCQGTGGNCVDLPPIEIKGKK